MKTVGIIGSRSFNNYLYAKKEILNIINDNNLSISLIISGGAKGSDKLAEKFAYEYNIPIEIILPDWSIGKHAGLLRNNEIIQRSDYVIAFWDGKSKGTLYSIDKAKKLNKKLFIVRISSDYINEGIKLNSDNTYEFNFNKDDKDDLLTLTYNKNYITTKKTDGIISYFSYKVNKNVDKKIRFDLLMYIKNDLANSDKYEMFLNKSVLGLFNNPNIDVSDVDLILIPESSSTVNFDLANKIKNKIPNALFLKDIILKNESENVALDYDLLNKHKYKSNTILQLENMLKHATIDGVFKIKKIPPMFRKYILNFLKLDTKDRRLLNLLVDGKVLIIDDIVSGGTTFREVNRLIENFAPKDIILFSLIA